MSSPDQHVDVGTVVLVIEDDRAYADILGAYLRHPVSNGVKSRFASGLKDGLAQLSADGIDVVLLDLHLPDSRGYDTFAQLRGAFPQVPVIVLSALEDDALARRAVRHGAQDFLFKIDLTPALLARSIGYAVERHRAEESLRDRERRFRALVEDQTELVCCCSPRGVLTFVNHAFARWFDVTSSDLVGQNLLDLFSEGDRVALATHLATLDRERPFQSREQRVVRPGAETRWLEWTDRALFDEKGELVELLSVGRDLTDQRRLEERLESAQRLEIIGGLVGHVTHEFNNILTAVMGYADLLAIRLTDPRPAEIAKLQTVARRAAALTGQLVAFSRRQIVRPETLDLNLLVTEIDAILRQLFDDQIVELVVEPADHPLWIHVDRGRIEQVIVNLALNARDAMPSGGRLTITNREQTLSARAAAELGLRCELCAVLEISDTGCGIDDAVEPRIFEPFFSTKPRSSGRGLGLAIVRRILQACGGAIQVESEREVGSVFRIYLPVVRTPRSRRHTSGVEHFEQPRKVLFVEDDPAVRMTLEAILENHGYDVHAAGSAADALRAFHEDRQWDLLLTDVGLPDRSGVELADEVLALRQDMRVLLITGRALETHPDRRVQDSRLPLLMKPFSAERLLDKLGQVLAE